MSDPQYPNILTRGLESALPNTYTDGKIRVTTDQQNMYLDLQSSRIKISDVISGYTETQIKALQSPLASKIYVASDTGKAFTYRNSAWINVGECNLVNNTTGLDYLDIWFGDNGSSPNHNNKLQYLPRSGTLKTDNILVSKINDMIVTVTENQDASHTVEFSFQH